MEAREGFPEKGNICREHIQENISKRDKNGKHERARERLLSRLEKMVVWRAATKSQDRDFSYYHRRALDGCKTRIF